MGTAQSLAAEIERAIPLGTVEQTLAANLADPVSIHHDPPAPTDGPMPAATFAALLTGNPMAAMVPDGVRTYGATTVAADTIRFETVLSGTTTAGDAIRVENITVMTVIDGRIAKLVQQYPPEAMAALMKLAAPASTE